MGKKKDDVTPLMFVSRRKGGAQPESAPASRESESRVSDHKIRRFFNFAHAEGSPLRNLVETRRTEG